MTNRLVTIIYKNQKIQTVQVSGSQSQCEDKAFEYADSILGLTEESQKEQVELYFHDCPRSQVLFSNIEIYSK